MKQFFTLFFLWMTCSAALFAGDITVEVVPIGSCGRQAVKVTGNNLVANSLVCKFTGRDAAVFAMHQSSDWSSTTGGYLYPWANCSDEGKKYEATLTISSEGAETREISLASFPVAVFPSVVEFDDVLLNTTFTKTVKIAGINILSEADCKLKGLDASAFKVEVISFDEAAMASTLKISFTPTEVKPSSELYYAAELVLGEENCKSKILLRGEGSVSENVPVVELVDSDGGCFDLSDCRIDFFGTKINVKYGDLWIDLLGTNQVGDIRYEVLGPDASAFEVTGSKEEDHGWNPSSGGRLYFSFHPTELRKYTASVSISSPKGYFKEGTKIIASPLVINLTGTGVQAEPSLIVENFNYVDGTCMTEWGVTIRGKELTGDIQCKLNGLDASAFSIKKMPDWDDRTGGFLRVLFNNPTHGAGRYSTTLTISTPGVESTSYDIETSKVTISTKSLSFGNIPICVTSQPQTIDVVGIDLSNPDVIKLEASSNPSYPDTFSRRPYKVSVLSYDEKTMKGKLSIVFTPTMPDSIYEETLSFDMGYEYRWCLPEVQLNGKGFLPAGSSIIDYQTGQPVFGGSIPGTGTMDFHPFVEQWIILSGTNLPGDGDIRCEISGPDASFFTTKGSEEGDYVWNPSTGGRLNFIFNPTEEREYHATATITCPGAYFSCDSRKNDYTSSLTIELTGYTIPATPPEVKLTVSPWFVGLEDTRIGAVSAPVKVNTTGIDLSSANSWNRVEGDLSPFTITVESYDPSTMNGVLNIRFTPEKESVQEAAVTWYSGLEYARIHMRGRGIKGEAPLNSTLTTSSSGTVFLYQDGGTETINVQGINLVGAIKCEFSGPNASNFTVEKLSSWDNKTGGDLIVKFNPSTIGEYKATLTISSPGVPNCIIPLSGLYKTLTPWFVGLEDTPIGERSTAMTIRTSGIDLSSSKSWDVEEGDLSNFDIQVGSYDPVTMAGSLNISFTPKREGIQEAAVTWYLGSVNARIHMRGNGIKNESLHPELTVSAPAPLIFNGEGVSKIIKVQGTGLIGDIRYQLSGFHASDFSIEKLTWDSKTGGELKVKYNPSSAGMYEVNLTISSSGASDYRVPFVALHKSLTPWYVGFENTLVGETSDPIKVYTAGINLSSPKSWSWEEGDVSNFKIQVESYDPVTSAGILNLSFIAKKEGVEEAAITWDLGSGIKPRIHMRGNGIKKSMSFGSVAVNTTSSIQMTSMSGQPFLKHSGKYDITGSESDARAFTVTPISYDEETGVEVLTVTFTPVEERPYNSSLVINGTEGVRVITLAGEGKKVSTGIEQVISGSVKVYPNPAVDQITVETSGEDIGKTVEIYTVYGTRISMTRMSGSTTTIDVSSLAKGTYIVRVNGKSVKVIKI